MHILHLPCDIHEYLLRFLSSKSKCRLMSTCSFLHRRLPPLVRSIHFMRKTNSYQVFLQRCTKVKALSINGVIPDLSSLVHLTGIEYLSIYPLLLLGRPDGHVSYNERQKQYAAAVEILLPWIRSQPIKSLRLHYRDLTDGIMESVCGISTLKCLDGLIPARFTPFLPPSLHQLWLITAHETYVNIDHLTSLRILKLNRPDNSAIYSQIRSLSHLRILDISVKSIIPELIQLPVTHLRVAITSEHDITILSQLSRLQRLHVAARYIHPSLGKLPITILKLPNCDGVSDLSFILRLTKLRRLYIDKISSSAFKTFLDHPKGATIVCRVHIKLLTSLRGNLSKVYHELCQYEDQQYGLQPVSYEISNAPLDQDDNNPIEINRDDNHDDNDGD